MRPVALVAALAASCGGGGLVAPVDLAEAPADLADVPTDLASAPQDLATPVDLATTFDMVAPLDMVPFDMAAAKLNCMGFSQCMHLCLGGGTDINTCVTQCSKNAKSGTSTKWIAAVLCGQQYCIGDADMMTGKCVEVAVPGMPMSFQLCDPGTTYAECTAATYVSTSCAPCLEQARNFWFEDSSVDPQNPGPPTGMCSMPTSADCMGAEAACGTQYDACRNDP